MIKSKAMLEEYTWLTDLSMNKCFEIYVTHVIYIFPRLMGDAFSIFSK